MSLDLVQVFEQARTGLVTAQRWVAFWGPVVSVPMVLGPFVAVASVVAVALLSGIAVSALAALLVVLMALYLLLTEVFGVSIDVVASTDFRS